HPPTQRPQPAFRSLPLVNGCYNGQYHLNCRLWCSGRHSLLRLQMGKIFVSYLRRDKSRVAGLVKELTDLGADIWWDEDSLAVGDRWRDNIELTIRECEYFIACFSRALPRWHTSTMEKEVRIAARLWRGRAAGDSKWILPVKLEDCSIPKI